VGRETTHAMLTKKAKLEQFDAMQRERDLLQRYFWDSREGVKPDAKARVRTNSGDVRMFAVYRVDAAHGGYIVLESSLRYETHGRPATRQFGTPSIRYWDEWQAETRGLTDYHSEYVQAARQAAEELRRTLPAHAVVYAHAETEVPRAW
jgi:hypothetical protein